MDPLSQAAIGAAAAQSGSNSGTLRCALWIGALAGMAPDLDVFIQSDTDPLLALEYHRQFTHSLLFIPFGALFCALAFYPIAKKHLAFKTVWLFAALGFGTHGLLDACTTYGLCWGISYLGFGLVQHQRALSAAEQLVSHRQHDPIRLEVKPGFANLLVWKALYEYNGRYYVDAIRAGVTPTYFPGESAPKFSLAKNFPSLNSDSQQASDIERFRWFSDGWLAIDSTDYSLIVDMRYSQLPNAIKGLWGVRIQPDAAAEQHVEWAVQRETGAKELAAFWQQLIGTGQQPLPR
jgi:inner membrane protein